MAEAITNKVCTCPSDRPVQITTYVWEKAGRRRGYFVRCMHCGRPLGWYNDDTIWAAVSNRKGVSWDRTG